MGEKCTELYIYNYSTSDGTIFRKGALQKRVGNQCIKLTQWCFFLSLSLSPGVDYNSHSELPPSLR